MVEPKTAAMNGTAERHVIVVGAGVGGLVASLMLALQGVKVTCLEQAATPGGKMRHEVIEGTAVDCGPTVFTLKRVFDAIFDAAGETLDAHVKLKPLSVLARHAWQYGEHFDLYADLARSVDAVGQFSGAAEARRFKRFCEDTRQLSARLSPIYIGKQKPTLLSMAQALGLQGVLKLGSLGPYATPFASLHAALARRLHDPRLVQLFSRYATYCGSSPYLSPATLMMVAQVEMDGVWQIEGGMHALALALVKLAQKKGAQFQYNTAVSEVLIQSSRVSGVRMHNGQVLSADAVVFNGDSSALSQGLLGGEARHAVPELKPSLRSLSAITWSIVAPTSGFALMPHNVFFDDDYASEFDDLFKHGRLPRKATVYMCAQDRTADTTLHTPNSAERLLCLVNAPSVSDIAPISQEEIKACENTSFALMQRLGLSIQRNSTNTVRTTPVEFHQRYPGTGGALYGQANHGPLKGWLSPFRRPGAMSKIPGLVLAGGSVHPGPGVPMAAVSGQLAAERVMAHLALTSRSRVGATSGGMSTPSATTASTA
jgi:1-hydroxycarotenoid 3,4-desaturase